MTANITTVSVTFENGIKREEYGPTKKAAATITAAVSDKEDGKIVLHEIGTYALAQVARLLDAPKPEVQGVLGGAATPLATSPEQAAAYEAAARPRRGRPPKAEAQTSVSAPAASEASEPDATTAAAASTAGQATTGQEWVSEGPAEITDEVLLKTTSERASALGEGSSVRIKELIASFSPKPAGQPFSVKELPQGQRQDYLNKLAELK